MTELKRKLDELDVKSRKNISVPNPSDKDDKVLEQVRGHSNNM